jgi:hypothetical protein
VNLERTPEFSELPIPAGADLARAAALYARLPDAGRRAVASVLFMTSPGAADDADARFYRVRFEDPELQSVADQFFRVVFSIPEPR